VRGKLTRRSSRNQRLVGRLKGSAGVRGKRRGEWCEVGWAIERVAQRRLKVNRVIGL